MPNARQTVDKASGRLCSAAAAAAALALLWHMKREAKRAGVPLALALLVAVGQFQPLPVSQPWT